MIIITAEFDLADPDRIDDAVAAATPIQQATRDEEPGCLAYVFSADPCLRGRMQVYELWEDEATLAAHFDHPNYGAMATALRDVGLANAVSQKFRVTAVEPVYDDTRTARADFFTQDEQRPDEMIIIAGEIDLDEPSARADTLARSVPLQQATRDGEPGCEAYVFSADPCVDGRIVVYELWDNTAALAPHFHHENYVNMGGLLRSAGITSTTRKYRCDLREPVYDDTPRARADFFTA